MSAEYKEKLHRLLESESGIYTLIINNEIYVGSAVCLPKRLRQHINDLLAKRHTNIHLQRAFDKYGEIDFCVLEIVQDVNNLVRREQFYIDNLTPRYNISRTAGSQLGFRHSEESRKKISKVQKGKKLSPETIQRMLAGRKGLPFTDEHRRKIAEAKMGDKNPFYKAGPKHPQYGRPKSTTTRERISATSKIKGCHRGHKNAAARMGVLYNVHTGGNILFLSLKPLCNALGINYKGMVGALHRKKFYKEQFYVDYIDLPAGHIESFINKGLNHSVFYSDPVTCNNCSNAQ